MKYFGIIDKNVAAIFQLQWMIGNISDVSAIFCAMWVSNQRAAQEKYLNRIIRVKSIRHLIGFFSSASPFCEMFWNEKVLDSERNDNNFASSLRKLHGEKFLCQNSKISFAGRLSVAVATWTVKYSKKIVTKAKEY